MWINTNSKQNLLSCSTTVFHCLWLTLQMTDDLPLHCYSLQTSPLKQSLNCHFKVAVLTHLHSNHCSLMAEVSKELV